MDRLRDGIDLNWGQQSFNEHPIQITLPRSVWIEIAIDLQYAHTKTSDQHSATIKQSIKETIQEQ